MSISAIAVTGLQASQMRLTASASNIANGQTTGRVASPGSAYQPLRAAQASLPQGGVASRIISDGSSPTLRYEPTSPGADATGMVTAPRMDLAGEAVEQLAALQAFRANAKVVQTVSEMERTTIERWG